MRDTLPWTISLGRWAGVQVRLHALFVVWGILVLHLATLDPRETWLETALASLAILLPSVLWHELGHCLVASRAGGNPDLLVLWPLGGLAPADSPREPRVELVVALGGPLASLLACLGALPLLWLHGVDLLPLMNPLSPWFLVDERMLGLSWGSYLALGFWLNWTLATVNLLPACPLDGGRILRALLWPAVGQRWAAAISARSTQLCAIGLCVAAWLLGDLFPFAWLPLVLLGVVLFFWAREELEASQHPEPEESLFGYDFSQGYTSLERDVQAPPRSKPGSLRQWLESRRAARLEKQRQQEADDDRRVDDILARLHERGMSGLSAEDRALLDRVSARYRNRLRG